MPASRKRKRKDGTEVSMATEPAAGAQRAEQPLASSPSWWAPVMVGLMIVGLVSLLATYISGGQLPVPGLGNWNLAIGFGVAIVGFLMTMRWK